jgi:CubicO group peptidase (beta-lactamase class C family)
MEMRNMKKVLAVLLVLCILLSAAACSNNVNTRDNNADVLKWPTEKWSISTPEKQDMDSGLLSKADKRIRENYPNVYSLLVVRHGYLVYEKYYQGMDKDSYNPVYSVTKSVMSALTGIALREKLITNTDQKVADFFPEYFTKIDDARKNEITINDTLTMSGGLESIDNNYNGYFSSGDWLDYTIKKPLTDKPGEKFVYNTGLPHFLSGIITKKSKMSTLSFANEFLFSKIGISIKKWDMDQTGYYGGGSGLYLTPVDMAKFGYLYLKNGLWDGQQIIPAEWIGKSTKKQIAVDSNVDYGYLFWIQNMKDKAHNKEYFTYRADGAGGQKIVVIPDLDLVVVITANYQSASKDKADTQAIIPDYVIPAVK